MYLIGKSESVTLNIFKWQLQDNVAEVIEPHVHRSFIFTMIVQIIYKHDEWNNFNVKIFL